MVKGTRAWAGETNGGRRSEDWIKNKKYVFFVESRIVPASIFHLYCRAALVDTPIKQATAQRQTPSEKRQSTFVFPPPISFFRQAILHNLLVYAAIPLTPGADRTYGLADLEIPCPGACIRPMVKSGREREGGGERGGGAH